MAGFGVVLLLAALLHAQAPHQARWQWPLRPRPTVLRAFDPPPLPWEPGHRGVDLLARPGQRVYAAGSGRVGFAGVLAGTGVVALVHGPLRTTYLPVRPAVHTGQAVSAGDRIGVVENVPGHCPEASCLHWGLVRGATYLDPLTLLGLGAVRLLPWWSSPGPAVEAVGGTAGPGSLVPRRGRAAGTLTSRSQGRIHAFAGHRSWWGRPLGPW